MLESIGNSRWNELMLFRLRIAYAFYRILNRTCGAQTNENILRDENDKRKILIAIVSFSFWVEHKRVDASEHVCHIATSIDAIFSTEIVCYSIVIRFVFDKS